MTKEMSLILGAQANALLYGSWSPLNSDVLPGLLNWGSVREGFLEEDILELNI